MEEHSTHTNLGEQIKQLRKELGLTQKDFREKIGVGLRRMSEIESGLNTLKPKEIELITSVFNLPTDYFSRTIHSVPLPDTAVRLSQLRHALNLTQLEMAKELTITQPNLASMENGNRIIGKHITNLILHTFKVNPVWWETGQGKMFR